MKSPLLDRFVWLAAIMLFLSGASDLWLAVVGERVLEIQDPVVFLRSRQVFYLVGGIQLAASAFLLAAPPRCQTTKLLLVGWLSASLLAYHFGSWSLGAPDLLGCLGNLTDKLPIPPGILTPAIVVIYGGLLVGACGLLVLNWVTRRRAARVRRVRERQPQVTAVQPEKV